MDDKWRAVCAPHFIETYKVAAGSAKVKGTPEVRSGIPVFPFDDYTDTEDILFVFRCPMVRVTAQSENGELAEVSFTAGERVYWDAGNARVTNVPGAHVPIGRALETVDHSAVDVGDSLLIALEPEISGAGAPVQGVANGYKIARGQHTTVAAADTVVTGLAVVESVVVSYETDPADANLLVSAQKGDQAGSPAAGSIIIKTWKTDGSDPTPAAADSFGKKVNWIAVGT